MTIQRKTRILKYKVKRFFRINKKIIMFSFISGVILRVAIYLTFSI